MRIGSLFSGVAGLELGLEYAGLGPVLWQVEWAPPIPENGETPEQAVIRARRQTDFHHAVLAKHWPHAMRYERVQDVGAHNLAPVDLLCGSPPCQDLSTANRDRAGLDGARSGLVFEMLRIVGELQPRWVVVENVYHAWRSWVPAVRESLWRLGYASVCLRVSAADVGARHRRARGFVVADRDGLLLRVQPGRRGWEDRIREAVARAALAHAARLAAGRNGRGQDGTSGRVAAADARRLGAGEAGRAERPPRCEPDSAAVRADGAANVGDPDVQGRQVGRGLGGDAREEFPAIGGAVEPWPGAGTAQPALGGHLYGLSRRLARRADRDRVKARRRDSIKALGNSVVPACAEAVGYVIQAIEAGRYGQGRLEL